MFWRATKPTVLAVSLWLAATAAQAETQVAQLRLNHHDILGRWCSTAGAYVIGRQRLVMIRYADGRKTRLPIRYFTFGLNRVTLYASGTDGQTTQMHFLNMRPLGPSFRQLKGGLYRRC